MKRSSALLSFIAIVVALGAILWPLVRSGFYVSDDGEWMIIRLSAFYQSLADGQFPVRFLGRLNNSYGYPVANFLYPGFLYIGSLLHFFGLSFVTSVKIILAGAIVGATLSVFAAMRRTYSSFAATMGTLAFIGSPYLLYDLYTRGSVGEVLAFLPAGVGIYSIVTAKPWLFALAVGGLTQSHNTLAVLFLAVFLVFMVIQRKRDFVWPFMIGIGLSAFFWIPAIAEKRYVRFDSVTVSHPMEYLLGTQTLWMVGFAGIVASCLLLLGNRKKLGSMTGAALALYTLSTLLALPVSALIWSVRPIASLVQFPYRMLAVGTLTAPWIVAAAVEKFESHKMLLIPVVFILLAAPSWHLLSKIAFIHRDEGFYTTNEATTTVSDEYMPRWVTHIRESRAPERLVFEKGRGSIVYEFLNTQRVVAHIDAMEGSLLRLHTIYYPGWGITIDGKPVTISYQNPHGFMEVSVPAGKHRLETEFRETISRFLADLISFGSGIVWVVFVWKGVKHR